ncbi:hypothetical protein BH10PSE5_BH10PSE5_01350 [soil metagenome]
MKLRPPPTPEAERVANYAASEAAFARLPRGDVLLKYQQRPIDRLFAGVSLLVIEKSRRIGLTWGLAAYAVLRAAARPSAGGMDVWYMGYDKDMAREFIETCAMWARAFGIAGEAADEEILDGDVQAHRLRFASGFKIVGLPSVARALRGKQGLAILDEAAFHSDLVEVLKAAIAFLMWGGQVVVVSTHDGASNPFNTLLTDVRSGKRKGEAQTITFDQALEEGLYERIAMIGEIKGKPPLPKEAWIADVRGTYADHASEELDCIPSRGAGSWLAYDQIERAENPEIPVKRLTLQDEFAHQPDHLRQAFVQDWCDAELLPIINAVAAVDTFGVGGDFARSSDLSVMWPMQEQQDRSWRALFVLEMRNVPYTEQEFIWKYVLRRLRRWRAALDAAGNGGYLAERLVQTFGESRVEAVLTNSTWWRDQGPPVKARFEDDRIEIPRDRDIASDLRAVKVENGVATVPMTRTTGKGEGAHGTDAKRHADAAVALVMAGYAIRLGVVGEIGFQSGGSALPSVNRDTDSRAFGVVGSELNIERF